MRYRVVTPFGTFTRSTVNSGKVYTHVVVVEPLTEAQIDSRLQRVIAKRYTRWHQTPTPEQLSAQREYTARWWSFLKSRQLGWTGRLDLARKLARQYDDLSVHIFDALTGQEVA